MEELGQSYGYILYRSTVSGPRDEKDIRFDEMHDRAQVFVDGELRGVYQRWEEPALTKNPAMIGPGKGESVTVDVLVENMGRVNYGPMLRDRKGTRGIRLGSVHHFGWNMYPLDMEDLSGLAFTALDEKIAAHPSFVRGTLEIEGTPADTFIRLDGFKKGFVKINGINIGRYFNEAGPQKTLYVPAPFLKEGKNEILVFESDGITDPTVTFLDTPDLGELENIYK
jgi:beta-galactosidase